MDKETLQQKIAEFFTKLPKEAQDVFSSMGWMETLKNIGTKYNLNEQQIELLGTETTLALLGIIHIEEYQKIIESELGLSEEIVTKIKTEIDENILKTIKSQLVTTFESNASSLTEEKVDPDFSTLPKNVQEAINNSGWKSKLYEIAGKYKLTISQMGILEESTIKVMRNEIQPNQYESDLSSKILIAKEEISNLVKDINQEILISIRELLKGNDGKKEEVVIPATEDIPLPPYSKPETKVEIEKIPQPIRPIGIKNDTINTTVNSSNPLPRSYDPYREQF